ncbi:transmembrane adaptor Erv26-domain-containing protein [Russula dissimulans]|nr:transmembrane adaptor Erv26-domain-containing protein [Russula dissimulans]
MVRHFYAIFLAYLTPFILRTRWTLPPQPTFQVPPTSSSASPSTATERPSSCTETVACTSTQPACTIKPSQPASAQTSLCQTTTAFSIICRIVYLQNFLDTWPVISLTSRSFIASCILVVADHFMWFFHFVRVTHEARQAAHKAYRGGPVVKVPTLGDMVTFFGLCIWLTPLFLFLSLSTNDNMLPTSVFPTCGTAALLLFALPPDIWLCAQHAPGIVTWHQGHHCPSFTGHPSALAVERDPSLTAHPDAVVIARRGQRLLQLGLRTGVLATRLEAGGYTSSYVRV